MTTNRDFTDLTLMSVADAADYLSGLKQDGCNGHLEFGSESVFIAHDGDTCPVHEDPPTVTYAAAVQAVRERTEGLASGNQEYERGQLELLADLFPRRQVETDTRVKQVAKDILTLVLNERTAP